MIRDIAWYVESGRFSGIVEEIDGAVRGYAEALEGNDLTLAEAAREKARSICEVHAVNSGFRPEGTFINVDAEFITGAAVDEPALERFVKEIVKAHAYQKVLWTYMGTTGNMTAISRSAMEADGLDWRRYMPVAWNRENPDRAPIATEENEVAIYAYPDGTLSSEYDRDKAKFRFDALRDSSGFNWNKGYDPNDTIRKDGWYGAFDADGSWVEIRTTDDKRIAQDTARADPVQPIRIVRDGSGAILHDPALFLLSQAEILYLAESGEPYGALAGDAEGTVRSIGETLKSMGIRKITGVAAPERANQGDAKKELDAYRAALGELADRDLALKTPYETAEAERRERERRDKSLAELRAIESERRAARASAVCDDKSLAKEAFVTARASVPYTLKKKADARALGLTDGEAELVAAVSAGSGKQAELDRALVNVYSGWETYKSTGYGRAEIAELIDQALSGKIPKEETVTAEATFRAIAVGDVLDVPGRFTEDGNYTLNGLVSSLAIGEAQADAVRAAMVALPEATSDQTVKNWRAVIRTLARYRSIAESTGMTIAEIVREAVKAAGGNPGTAAPITGYVSQAARQAATERRVFFEIPVVDLAVAAAKAPRQTRDMPLSELERNGEIADILVIGGSSGIPLDEAGLDAETLNATGRLTKGEARSAAEFLHAWRAAEGSEGEAIALIRQIALEALVPPKGKKTTAADFQARFLEKLDSRTDVRYNPASSEGKAAIVKSSRYAGTGITAETIEAVAAEICPTPEPTALPGIARRDSVSANVTPVMKAKTVTAPAKTTLKGLPEPTRPLMKRTLPDFLRTSVAYGPATGEALPSEPDPDTVVIEQTATAVGHSLLHTPDLALPLLVFGGLDGVNSPGKSHTTLADLANLTAPRLVERGLSTREAGKSEAFFRTIAVPEENAERTKRDLLPIVDEVIASTITTKSIRERLVSALERRTDVAFNLSNPEGRSAWKTGTNYLLAPFDDAELDKKAADRTDPLIARKLPQPTANTSEALPYAIVPKAQTKLSTGENLIGESQRPVIFMGGSGKPTKNGNDGPGITHATLDRLANVTQETLETVWGFTATEAKKTLAAMKRIEIEHTAETAHGSQSLIPSVKEALTDSATAKEFLAHIERSFAQRGDVAYNLATNQGRASYLASERFRESGLTSGELDRLIATVTGGRPEAAPDAQHPGIDAVPSIPVFATPHVRAASRPATVPLSVYSEKGALAHPSAQGQTLADAAFPETTAKHKEFTAKAHAEIMAKRTNTAESEATISASVKGNPNRPAPSTAEHTETNHASSALGQTQIPGSNSTKTANNAPATPAAKRQTGPEAEADRMRRIQANYEHDKAQLAKEQQPALTRSATHDVGHAEGSGEGMERRELNRLKDFLGDDIKEQLAKKM